jgi:hypothetical protein
VCLPAGLHTSRKEKLAGVWDPDKPGTSYMLIQRTLQNEEELVPFGHGKITSHQRKLEGCGVLGNCSVGKVGIFSHKATFNQRVFSG